MEKRILITATDLMTVQFLLPHIRRLAARGFAVELACSPVGGRLEEIRTALAGTVRAIYPLRLKRSPFSPVNLMGLGQLKNLIAPGKYHIIWTNEPVMGAMTRLAARSARKRGTKVVYMCHGFHFFRGANPGLWLFYPVESYLSRFTDVLVTVNREDEARAKTFHAGRVAYIRGIGMDPKHLQPQRTPDTVRQALGLRESDFLVLSVGELNKNKNHAVILRALAMLNNPRIHYVICGTGARRKPLEALAKKLGLGDRVHLPGYCPCIGDYLQVADLFAFPSRREGLGLAALEAMHSGLALVASDIRGVRDYGEEAGFLCRPDDAAGFARAIGELKDDPSLRRRFGGQNRETAKLYGPEQASADVLALFEGI